MCSSEIFASRLNRVLDSFDFPKDLTDRQHAFGEIFNIPQQKAQMILTGTVVPKKRIIDRIADELFIDSEELLA